MLLSCNQPKRDYIYNFKFNNFKYFEIILNILKKVIYYFYILRKKKKYTNQLFSYFNST